MNLKNITLKTAELGPVLWENVEKLQPSNSGFIFFISSHTAARTDENGEQYSILVGDYIQTDFNHKPTYKEVINWIVKQEYPDGKENQMLRYGIYDPDDEEYLEYYNNVENISSEVKSLLK